MGEEKPVRHLLGLSGGKDSAVLAIYLRDRVPEDDRPLAELGLIETRKNHEQGISTRLGTPKTTSGKITLALIKRLIYPLSPLVMTATPEKRS